MNNTFLLRNHKAQASRYQNEFHGAYNKIFKILDEGQLGFVEIYWEESFKREKNTDNWILKINVEPEPNKLQEILSIKNVELIKG